MTAHDTIRDAIATATSARLRVNFPDAVVDLLMDDMDGGALRRHRLHRRLRDLLAGPLPLSVDGHRVRDAGAGDERRIEVELTCGVNLPAGQRAAVRTFLEQTGVRMRVTTT